MNYKINDKPLKEFGLLPGRQPNSNIAISGCWDMPSRIGKAFHDWGDENGIEPYLRFDEIFFGGRDISIICWLSEGSRVGFVGQIQELYDYIDSLQDSLFTLSCELGSWNVQMINATSVNYLNNGWGNIQLNFREPVVYMNGVILSDNEGEVGIDNFSFAQLGLVKTLTKDQANRPASKQIESTSYGYEKISKVKRTIREFSIDFFLDHPNYNAFNACINNLMYLLSKPNARTLRLDDGTTREFFVKDGFKVSKVRKNGDRVTGFLQLNIAEIKMLENWNLLTDNSGLKLVDKYGQPLTELLKGF